MPTAPTGLFLQLHTGNPGTAGTNNVAQSTITGSANRTPVTQSDLGAVTAISAGGFECPNATAITVTSSSVSATAVLVSHVSLWTAITGGNCLQFDALALTTEVRFGDLVKFDPATFSVSVL
jgi:hypothetical protein